MARKRRFTLPGIQIKELEHLKWRDIEYQVI